MVTSQNRSGTKVTCKLRSEAYRSIHERYWDRLHCYFTQRQPSCSDSHYQAV